jgi:hypothetical protein
MFSCWARKVVRAPLAYGAVLSPNPGDLTRNQACAICFQYAEEMHLVNKEIHREAMEIIENIDAAKAVSIAANLKELFDTNGKILRLGKCVESVLRPGGNKHVSWLQKTSRLAQARKQSMEELFTSGKICALDVEGNRRVGVWQAAIADCVRQDDGKRKVVSTTWTVNPLIDGANAYASLFAMSGALPGFMWPVREGA